jgi:hypothetical protein
MRYAAPSSWRNTALGSVALGLPMSILARDWATGFRPRWASRGGDAACETLVPGRRNRRVRYDYLGSMVTSFLDP